MRVATVGCALVVAAGSVVGGVAGARGSGLRSHARARYAVGIITLRLVDATRTIRLPGGRRKSRTLVTYVRYPAIGSPSTSDQPGLTPDRSGGPYPLIVFGHGFRVTPAIYGRLLRSWAAAGYVVASPVFPLENANAPGGPDERDLVNQPADVSFAITRLLAENTSGSDLLHGMIDPRRIAVAGHSDGAETALAVAYARGDRDTRVRAAVILSGAKIDGLQFEFSHPSMPLLATQGTADTLNHPSDTRAFFDAVPRPKFLLTLLGARHLAPYTYEQPQLHVVQAVTRAFLDHVFKNQPVGPLVRAATVPGLAELAADT